MFLLGRLHLFALEELFNLLIHLTLFPLLLEHLFLFITSLGLTTLQLLVEGTFILAFDSLVILGFVSLLLVELLLLELNDGVPLIYVSLGQFRVLAPSVLFHGIKATGLLKQR